MKKMYYKWDHIQANYRFWNSQDDEDNFVTIEEDQFDNTLEKLQAEGAEVEEWDE